MSQPPTFHMPQTAHVPGQTSMVGTAREWVSVPRLVMFGLLVLALREYLTPAAKKKAEESAGVCQSKYCTTAEMFVDTPLHTQMKDQSLGAGLGMPRRLPGPVDVKNKIKSDLYREQLMSPGVQLIAPAI